MDYSRLIAVFGITILIATAVSTDDYVKEQPDYVTPCKLTDPEFEKCNTHTVQQLFAQLAIGVPGLKSVGPIDPFFIKKLFYKQDNTQVATISANLTDLTVKGFGNTIVKNNKISRKDFGWTTDLLVPKMRMDGKYKMVGKILVVPLQGNGQMFIEIDNLLIKAFSKIRLYEKGGFTFYNVTAVRIQITISRLKTRFDNLFGGNKELENSTNDFFNKNWPELFEALRPVVMKTVEDILLNIMQNVFHYIPASFFVTDIPTPQQFYGSS